MATKLCLNCGKEFTAINPSALEKRKYCNHFCANNHTAAVRAISVAHTKSVVGYRATKLCIGCGKTISDYPSVIGRRHYCSKSCSDKYRRSPQGAEVPCPICSKVTYKMPSVIKNGYRACSRECGAKWAAIRHRRWEHIESQFADPLPKQKNGSQQLRLQALAAYGNKCTCCGESHYEFLAIDHINGGGHKHRKELKRRGTSYYTWLRREGFPPGYQVLCHNCNLAKGFYGKCPHEKFS